MKKIKKGYSGEVLLFSDSILNFNYQDYFIPKAKTINKHKFFKSDSFEIIVNMWNEKNVSVFCGEKEK